MSLLPKALFRQTSALLAHDISYEMKKETVEKTSAEQTPTKASGASSAPSNTELGAITQSSDGPGHRTEAHRTTSTGSPTIPLTQDFFDKLGEMHDAEKRLTHALPLLRLVAKSEDLATLLGVHLEETSGHVKSLEELARLSDKKLPSKTCQPIADLIKESELELIKKILDPAARDAAIIAAGRKIEQFEISAYQPLCELADANDWTHERAILTSILHQEQLASDLLAGLAEGKESLDELIPKVTLAHAKGGAS